MRSMGFFLADGAFLLSLTVAKADTVIFMEASFHTTRPLVYTGEVFRCPQCDAYETADRYYLAV